MSSRARCAFIPTVIPEAGRSAGSGPRPSGICARPGDPEYRGPGHPGSRRSHFTPSALTLHTVHLHHQHPEERSQQIVSPPCRSRHAHLAGQSDRLRKGGDGGGFRWELSSWAEVKPPLPLLCRRGACAHAQEGRQRAEGEGGAMNRERNAALCCSLDRCRPGGRRTRKRQVPAIRDRAEAPSHLTPNTSHLTPPPAASGSA